MNLFRFDPQALIERSDLQAMDEKNGLLPSAEISPEVAISGRAALIPLRSVVLPSFLSQGPLCCWQGEENPWRWAGTIHSFISQEFVTQRGNLPEVTQLTEGHQDGRLRVVFHQVPSSGP